MKTIQDLVDTAYQIRGRKMQHEIHSDIIDAIKNKTVTDLAALKQIFVTWCETRILDVTRCDNCASSHRAKVWLMCDKFHKRAPSFVCEHFTLNQDGKDEMEYEQKELHDLLAATTLDEFLAWLSRHEHWLAHVEMPCWMEKDLCNLPINGMAAAKQQLMALSKKIIADNQQYIEQAQYNIQKAEENITAMKQYIAEYNRKITEVNALAENLI